MSTFEKQRKKANEAAVLFPNTWNIERLTYFSIRYSSDIIWSPNGVFVVPEFHTCAVRVYLRVFLDFTHLLFDYGTRPPNGVFVLFLNFIHI